MQSRQQQVLLAFAAFLLVFAGLFLGRSADDNTLFSWSWSFSKTGADIVYIALAAGLGICAFLSRAAVPDRCHVPLLAALSFGAAVPFWMQPELILDASRYFVQAKHLELYGVVYFIREWGNAIVAWTDLPLVPFLYGLVFKIFGEQRIAVQVFTTILFALTTVLTFLIGSRIWDRETGFSGALLLLSIPYLLTQVPLMLVDVPTMFFLTLSIFAFLEALHRGGSSWAAFSVLAVVCTVLSKYSAWFMLSVLPVALAVHVFRESAPNRGAILRRGIGILAAAALVSGLVLFLKFDTFSQQIALLAGYQKPGLGLWSETFLSTFLFQIHPFITLAAFLSVAAAVRQRDSRYVTISWLLLLVVLFGVRRIRYILPVFPMLALMAGYGMQAVKTRGLRRFLVYGVVASSLTVAILVYLPFARSMNMMNLMRAGAYLDTLGSGEIEVITLASGNPVLNPAVSVPLLDLFTGRPVRYEYRPEAFPPPYQFQKSPLRFTWEYSNPVFYAVPFSGTGDAPVVVIADARADRLPQHVERRLSGYRLRKAFTENENVFQFSLGVGIYEKSTETAPNP